MLLKAGFHAKHVTTADGRGREADLNVVSLTSGALAERREAKRGGQDEGCTKGSTSATVFLVVVPPGPPPGRGTANEGSLPALPCLTIRCG